MYLST
ncbi:hypothetical protein BIW11_14302 [Tropilaelaps mercedesae]